MSHFCETGNNLLLEVKKSQGLVPYNASSVAIIARETVDIATSLATLSHSLTPEEKKNPTQRSALIYQSHIMRRNKRCAMAYINARFHKICDLWWSCGNNLPSEIKDNLSTQEVAAYEKYDSIMTKYIRSSGVSVSTDIQPPQTVYIEVEALEDLGEIMTMDGPVLLNKYSRHLLRRSECELFIRQGLLRHIPSANT